MASGNTDHFWNIVFLAFPFETRNIVTSTKEQKRSAFSALSFSTNVWIPLDRHPPYFTGCSKSHPQFLKSILLQISKNSNCYHNNINVIGRNSDAFDCAVFDRMLYMYKQSRICFLKVTRKGSSQIWISVKICDSCRFLFGCKCKTLRRCLFQAVSQKLIQFVFVVVLILARFLVPCQ